MILSAPKMKNAQELKDFIKQYDVPWTSGFALSTNDMFAVAFGAQNSVQEQTLKNLKDFWKEEYEDNRQKILTGILKSFIEK